MNELMAEARALYLDLIVTAKALEAMDEVVIFTGEYDIDLGQSLHFVIQAMLFTLAVSDGVICDDEIEFISQVLDEETSPAVIWSMTEDHADTINKVIYEPIILSVLADFDLKMALDFVDKIESIGIYFVAVDGDSDDREVSVLASIIESMTQCAKKSHGFLDSLYREDSDVSSLVEKNQDNEIDDSLCFDDLLKELHSLIGLGVVKEEVLSLANLVKVRQLRLSHNMPIPPMSFHLVFSGNPGTGKTTVARLLSKIYKALGLLSRGHLIEVDRSGLVAGYVGQTAIKVSDVIKESLGGILFIDEAYTLVSNQDSSDYGREAIDTILKAMEDNRGDLVVIVAGYTDRMDSFLQSNPGLKSRFNKFVHFNDYNSEEMLNILLSLCKKSGYIVTKDARQLLAKLVVYLDNNRSDNFGNGREIRNKFEVILQHQANRIMSNSIPTRDELQTITADDILPLLPI